jgi:hypothetical protein
LEKFKGVKKVSVREKILAYTKNVAILIGPKIKRIIN